MQPQQQITLNSEIDTLALGKQLAKQLHPGQVVFLEGNLGAVEARER